MAVYSAKFESLWNQLQQVDINLKTVNDYRIKLVDILQFCRHNPSFEFYMIFAKTQEIIEKFYIEINLSSETADFFRESIFIPYLDSVISSLKYLFSSAHNKSFSFIQFHPYAIKDLSKNQFICIANDVENLYGKILLSNFVNKATAWFEMWKNGTKPFDSVYIT